MEHVDDLSSSLEQGENETQSTAANDNHRNQAKMDGNSMSTSKLRRNSGLPINVSSYNYDGMEELQPGVDFVSWGEHGPPERVQPAPLQESIPTVVEPTPHEPPLVDSTEHGVVVVVSSELIDPQTLKPGTGGCFFKNRRIWCTGLLLLIVLTVAAVVLAITVSGRTAPVPGAYNGVTTQMAPFTTSCSSWYSEMQPNVITQCICLGKITTVADDVKESYQRLLSGGFVKAILPNFSSTIESCNPTNQALLWLASATGFPSPDVNLQQRFTLALLYITWNGRLWLLSDSWLSSDSECIWKGVSCDRFGTVTGVDLYNNQVSGNLGTEFALLTSLTALSLGQNSMHGSLPSELGSLTSMTTLDLQSNQLTGSLPVALAQLSHLQELRATNNRLSGTIPTWLGSLVSLQILSLSNNTFHQLGAEMGNGSGGSPSGVQSKQRAFPTEIGQLTQLLILELGAIGLSGTIPTEVFNLGNALQFLTLSENSLSGTISSLFGDLTAIQEVGLQQNRLSGDIPPEFVRCTGLTFLYLSNNQLRGTVPSSLGLLTNLETLSLEGNLLSGTMPQSVCKITQPQLCSSNNFTCSCCVCNV